MARVAIIGAGPAGLSCALKLLELGYEVNIFEEHDRVGGLSRTLEIGGQLVDIGTHSFVSKLSEVQQMWHEYMPLKEQVKFDRISYINYQQQLFSYPLKGFEALSKLGFAEASLCVLSALKAKIIPFKDNTFESYIANAFGYRLYQHFFKDYTEKLWGIPCDQLDPLFAEQRVGNFNLFKAIKDAFISSNKNEYDKDRSSYKEISYPKKGIGSFYERLAQKIISLGGKINYNCHVQKILSRKHQVYGISYTNIGYSDRIIHECDYVVSTGLFNQLASSLDNLPLDTLEKLSQLTYRNTRCAYIKVKPNSIPKASWIYINDSDVNLGRISDYSKWSLALKQGQEEDMLCLEFWAQDNDPIWTMSDENFCILARSELLNTALIEDVDIVETYSLKVPNSYPIYTSGIQEQMQAIAQDLDQYQNLYFIGRTGAFKYNNQDHSILMGICCARKIAGQYQESLWNI